MIIPNDNLSAMPTADERLIARGHKAMEDYLMGSSQAIQGVIEYGRVLLEKRTQFNGNRKAFGQWISANGFDQDNPWNDRIERQCAMQIAEIYNVGSIANINFDACPNTRPTHIMQWYRKTHGQPSEKQERKPRKAKPAPQFDAAYKAIDEAMGKGRTISNWHDFAKEIGVAHGTLEKARVRWQHEHENEETKVRSEDGRIERSLSDNDKITLAQVKRIHKERAEKELAKERKKLEAEIGIKIREGIAKANDAMRAHNSELMIENLELRQRLNQRGAFTETEFKLIRNALHPDTRPDAKGMAEAFSLFNGKKDLLLKEIPKKRGKK